MRHSDGSMPAARVMEKALGVCEHGMLGLKAALVSSSMKWVQSPSCSVGSCKDEMNESFQNSRTLCDITLWNKAWATRTRPPRKFPSYPHPHGVLESFQPYRGSSMKLRSHTSRPHYQPSKATNPRWILRDAHPGAGTDPPATPAWK